MNLEPRDIALQKLYEAEQRATDEIDLMDLPEKSLRIITGVTRHRLELDRSIEQASEHWTLDRMPPVDRTILRMGLYELRFEAQTPTAVVITECVRLARTYSTERSGSFVNGVLGHLADLERG